MVITATPLLRRSPHVLYTNVIEPVLRWHLVRRGYALAHSACLNFNGNALIITAKTDTGKTTTILEALNNYRCAFLSDDMTILSPDGMAINYPKPLTISKHTLQVAVRSALGRKEKAFLQIQGRLHSRSGRRFGLLLSRLRLPASTINALFQMIVPPPKYSIQQLIPEVQLVKSSPLSRLVIIERGVADKIDLGMDQAVEILIKNCEDAYGFPPYPELADQLCNWNGTDLHIKEREIITSALSNCTAVRLRSSSYDWWRDLVDHGNGSRLRS